MENKKRSKKLKQEKHFGKSELAFKRWVTNLKKTNCSLQKESNYRLKQQIRNLL